MKQQTPIISLHHVDAETYEANLAITHVVAFPISPRNISDPE